MITLEEGQPSTRSARVRRSIRTSRAMSSGEDAATPSVKPVDKGDTYDGDADPEIRRGADARGRAARLRLHGGASPRGDRDSNQSHTVSIGFVDRRGAARLHRADQRARQHPHARLRHSTRVRHRRGRPLQQGTDRSSAERRLNSLGFFKKVKITNLPGSSSPTASSSTSTWRISPPGSFGDLRRIFDLGRRLHRRAFGNSETNFLGRGQFVKLAIQEGQNARGVDLTFTEPYIFDTRIAAGFDLFAKQNDNTQYSDYKTFVTGGTLRLGVPITDEFSISPHYSIYNTQDQRFPTRGTIRTTTVTFPIERRRRRALASLSGVARLRAWSGSCLTNGEASLLRSSRRRVRHAHLAGIGFERSITTRSTTGRTRRRASSPNCATTWRALAATRTSCAAAGDLRYYHGIPCTRTSSASSTCSGRSYRPASATRSQLRIVGRIPARADPRARLRAERDRAARHQRSSNSYKYNPLGRLDLLRVPPLEVQFPIPALPRDLGLRGAVFSDAGTLFGYQRPVELHARRRGVRPAEHVQAPSYTQGTCVDVEGLKPRSGPRSAPRILWASPLGPIRFDYAYAL